MSNQQIDLRISKLNRDDLETDSAVRLPSLQPAMGNLQFVRLTRLARFWKGAAGWIGLQHRAQNLITSLSSVGQPWSFVIFGTPGRCECWFGLPLSSEEARMTLRGAFADVRFGGDALDSKQLAFRYTAQMTGIPGRGDGCAGEENHDPISSLCRALYGAEWMYGVYASPIVRGEVIRLRNETLEEIRRTQTAFLQKGVGFAESNRPAQLLSDMLEALLKRLDKGRALGMWETRAILATNDAATLACGCAAIHGAFANDTPLTEPIRTCLCLPAAGLEYSQVIHGGELSLIAHPPAEEFPGYELVEHVRFGLEPPARNASDGPSFHLGAILDSGRETGNALAIPLRDLSKHALVVGVTGSGKTNTCFRILEQAWDGGRGVPFLVVESAKSEYRSLVHLPGMEKLKVFTVGDETTSPVRLNPFEVPRGTLVQSHIDYLKSLFSAAFVLYPPMPYVLEQGLREVYTDRGWDLARNSNQRGTSPVLRFPTLSDLVAKVDGVVDRMGYDERITMDVKAGLVARLDQLRSGGGKGPMLDTRVSIPAPILFETPCVLELKRVVDDDEKAFLIGLILIRLYEYYEGAPNQAELHPSGLRHVTLLEEAHRLMRNVSTEQGGEVAANPKGRAIEVFANILSEIRAYGEGFLIAEQVPVKLVPDAIKNTNLKIVHRLVADDDRKAVGGAMNLDEAQMRYLATLSSSRGEGVAYAEGMQRPVLISAPLSEGKRLFKETKDEFIRESPAMKSFWRDHRALRLPFAGCKACRGSVSGGSCANRRAARAGGTLEDAFHRLFGAFWLDADSMVDAYKHFRHLSLRAPSSESHAAYCMFVELAEAHIERRGAYWGWSHRDVELIVALGCEIVDQLERQNAAVNQAGPDSHHDLCEELREKLQGLHRSARAPFAGCVACRNRCFYRYDMQLLPWDSQVSDFREAIRNPDPDGGGDFGVLCDALAGVCDDAAAELIDGQTAGARNGAALCFGVQQLAAMCLPRDFQEDVARGIAEHLDSENGAGRQAGNEGSS